MYINVLSIVFVCVIILFFGDRLKFCSEKRQRMHGGYVRNYILK